MVIRRLSTGQLYLSVWAVRQATEQLSLMVPHMNKSYPGGVSIFHQTSSSIMDAARQPRLSPDRGRLITLVQPFLRRDDVHAPQTPVVAVGRVGILLHLERVVLDVVYGGQDDAGVILLHPGQDGFSPSDWEKTQELRADFWNQVYTKLQCTVAKAEEKKKPKNWEMEREEKSLLQGKYKGCAYFNSAL